jgi:hypothetical protein
MGHHVFMERPQGSSNCWPEPGAKNPVMEVVFLISCVNVLSLLSAMAQYFSCCWLNSNRLP